MWLLEYVEIRRLAILTEQSVHFMSFDELARLIEVIVDDGLGIDADRVIDTRKQLSRMHTVVQRS